MVTVCILCTYKAGAKSSHSMLMLLIHLSGVLKSRTYLFTPGEPPVVDMYLVVHLYHTLV